MIDTLKWIGSPPPRPLGPRSVSTSLFGSAILATVATASLSQATYHYFDTSGSLANATVSSGYVVLGAMDSISDGGGGTFMPGATSCTPDFGIVVQDTIGHCFFRTDPTYSVREWGARCDVVAVNAAGAASWTSGSTMGTLTFPTTLVSTPPVVIAPGTASPEFIAISQIGSPTLFGLSTPAVSLTRFSTLSNTGTSYSPGNVVSFAGGTFSQQAAIVVDATDLGGAITQWHFLWGGLYKATSLPTSPMAQDNTHTYCGTMATAGTFTACGTQAAIGATLIPAWSGWSVLNSQSISNVGTGYTIGQIVTLTAPGATVNHYATLVVEGTTSGGVTAFDWIDYGSFSTLTNTGTLTDVNPLAGLTFSPVAWTQGPYASTIISAGTVGVTGMSTIVVAGIAAFPGATAIQYFYYGHDDSVQITSALGAKPASALTIPAGCGTTKALDIMVDSSSNNANPSLVGSNSESSGLYSFAAPPAYRNPNLGGTPVLSSVLYAGILDATTTQFDPAQGGGFRNMFVEGFGIPEGYGYWGLAEGGLNPPPPLNYVGPMFTSPTPKRTNIPVAGTAVELDKTVFMRIDNVHISDGGIGMGNSALQCGINDSDPTGVLGSDVGSIVFTDSRLDSNPAFFAGPSNPDFALNMSCHDSVFQNLSVYDAITADVQAPGGNVFGQIHVGSSAINATLANGAPPTINWPAATIANFGFAGVANYGLYVTGNTSLSQTRCDIADIACVFMSVDYRHGQENPGQITDTQIGCAAFTSVPTGYEGVQLPAGALGVAVGGTAAAGRCAMPPAQLVVLDGLVDPTTSLCNNSNAPVAGCTGYQGGFQKSQYSTQPATSYGTVALSGNTLYAVPFYSPAGGGTISQLGLYVSAAGTSGTQCELGVYNALAGRPMSQISNGGTLSVSSTGGTTTSAGTVSVQLAPATLYFLVVGCNGTVTVEGVTNTGALTAPLTGAPNFATTTTGLTAAWTFSSGLPSTFVTNPTITAGGPVPNVYAGP